MRKTINGAETKEVETAPTTEYTDFDVTCEQGEFYHRGVQYFHQRLDLETAIYLVSIGYQYVTLK